MDLLKLRLLLKSLKDVTGQLLIRFQAGGKTLCSEKHKIIQLFGAAFASAAEGICYCRKL
jgi:hypothetical protein